MWVGLFCFGFVLWVFVCLWFLFYFVGFFVFVLLLLFWGFFTSVPQEMNKCPTANVRCWGRGGI